VQYYEGFIEDITERKQAEAEIRNALRKKKNSMNLNPALSRRPS